MSPELDNEYGKDQPGTNPEPEQGAPYDGGGGKGDYPTPTPVPGRRRWWEYALTALLFLLIGILISIIIPPEIVEVDVTRIVPVTEEVTRIVPEEVTKIIEATVVVTEEVTRIVPSTEEVTRIVTETEEVTRIVTETEEVTREVTREVIQNVPVEVTRVVVIPPPPPSSEGQACTRFDLEEGRNKENGTPLPGLYVMQEAPADSPPRIVATWRAETGWLDSGWLNNLAISHESVYVEVYFYPEPWGEPIRLEILNPASGTPYGWLTRNVCHAIEVQFPLSS